MKNFHPFQSFITTLYYLITFQIHYPKNYNGMNIVMPNRENFEIFRHIIVGDNNKVKEEKGALFIVNFKLSKMSVEKNIFFSLFPIPFFIGLPGFKAKFWFLNKKNGYNQGLYQWETEQHAIKYSKSFAVNFMKKRSEPNSISYTIIPNMNIYDYIFGIAPPKKQNT